MFTKDYLETFLRILKACMLILVILAYLMIAYLFGTQIKEIKEFPTHARSTTATITGDVEFNNYVDIKMNDVPTISTVYIPSSEYVKNGTVQVYYHPENPTMVSILQNGERDNLVAYIVMILILSYMTICTIYVTFKDTKKD